MHWIPLPGMYTQALVLEVSWDNVSWTHVFLLLLSSTLISKHPASCWSNYCLKLGQTCFQQGLCTYSDLCLESSSWKCPHSLFPHFKTPLKFHLIEEDVSLYLPILFSFLHSPFYDLSLYVFLCSFSVFPTPECKLHGGNSFTLFNAMFSGPRAVLISLHIRWIYAWPPKFRCRMWIMIKTHQMLGPKCLSCYVF